MRPCWHVCLAFAVLGCAAKTTSKMIGPEGGQVRSIDGTAVAIPAGALPTNTAVTIVGTSAPAPTRTQGCSTAHLFGPEGIHFTQPVTVTLTINAGMVPAGKTNADVVIYTAAAGSSDYQPLATTPVDATHVQAKTAHFSVFVPCVPDESVPVVDLSVPVVGNGGGGGGGSGADLSGVHDLLSPADLESSDLSGPCTRVYANGPNSVGCTWSASCHGHKYFLNCTQYTPQNGICCDCYVDNTRTNQASDCGANGSNLACSPYDNAGSAWSFCRFP
jgi:hypothetical protein